MPKKKLKLKNNKMLYIIGGILLVMMMGKQQAPQVVLLQPETLQVQPTTTQEIVPTCSQLCSQNGFSNSYQSSTCQAGETKLNYGYPGQAPLLVCCCYNPTTFPDNDGDGIPDSTDTDDDNDGWSDDEEIQIGTNPLDSKDYPGAEQPTVNCNSYCINLGYVSGKGPYDSCSVCPPDICSVDNYGNICCCTSSADDAFYTNLECSNMRTTTFYHRKDSTYTLSECQTWVAQTCYGSYTPQNIAVNNNCCFWDCTYTSELYTHSSCQTFASDEGLPYSAITSGGVDWTPSTCLARGDSDCHGYQPPKQIASYTFEKNCCAWSCKDILTGTCESNCEADGYKHGFCSTSCESIDGEVTMSLYQSLCTYSPLGSNGRCCCVENWVTCDHSCKSGVSGAYYDGGVCSSSYPGDEYSWTVLGYLCPSGQDCYCHNI